MCVVLKDNQSEDCVVATGDPRVYQPKGRVIVGRCRRCSPTCYCSGQWQYVVPKGKTYLHEIGQKREMVESRSKIAFKTSKIPVLTCVQLKTRREEAAVCLISLVSLWMGVQLICIPRRDFGIDACAGQSRRAELGFAEG